MEAESRTSIDLGSLARIAALAVAQTDGLDPVDDPADGPRGDGAAVVEVDADGSLRVRLRVHGHWGTSLPRAASRLRREVVRVTAAMTGLHVARVDVEVVGLLAPGPTAAPAPAPAGSPVL
ncbi:hypothetical protein ASG49_14055 [Marmoricola sp. Leaf446]|uniref:Asp23/Gls24 family envelope stress response protein n=1 Tax=Marmoricola sp. Leaf446 TaxID=1736379 RepID=UPI0007015635|nr:Asp23/Gls24 family envelope stress response protein [Marmoricola sp. Leaf446]KQT90849.1 hypothetical protein ASG49_14055 [Marmoricola sp. Leaf446]